MATPSESDGGFIDEDSEAKQPAISNTRKMPKRTRKFSRVLKSNKNQKLTTNQHPSSVSSVELEANASLSSLPPNEVLQDPVVRSVMSRGPSRRYSLSDIQDKLRVVCKTNLSLVTKLELNERKLVSTSKKNDELTSISRTARAREKEAKMIAQSAEEEAIRLQNEMDSKLREHEKQAKSELDFELTKARASCTFFLISHFRKLFS
jgi:hypothetical protein